VKIWSLALTLKAGFSDCGSLFGVDVVGCFPPSFCSGRLEVVSAFDVGMQAGAVMLAREVARCCWPGGKVVLDSQGFLLRSVGLAGDDGCCCKPGLCKAAGRCVGLGTGGKGFGSVAGDCDGLSFIVVSSD
jgi:hypothetical protein